MQGSALTPDEACPACGTRMARSEAPLGHVVNGVRVTVSGLAHLRCPACGEGVLDYDESRELQRRAVECYRKDNDLLAAAEIRALRESLGLTRSQLARLLRLGPNTVSRWESGRNAQSASMDLLLRIVRDIPAALAYLRGVAA